MLSSTIVKNHVECLLDVIEPKRDEIDKYIKAPDYSVAIRIDWQTRFASSGTNVNRYLYAGEQWDADLRLYYLRARYLNPETGRFLTLDSHPGSKVRQRGQIYIVY